MHAYAYWLAAPSRAGLGCAGKLGVRVSERRETADPGLFWLSCKVFATGKPPIFWVERRHTRGLLLERFRSRAH